MGGIPNLFNKDPVTCIKEERVVKYKMHITLNHECYWFKLCIIINSFPINNEWILSRGFENVGRISSHSPFNIHWRFVENKDKLEDMDVSLGKI